MTIITFNISQDEQKKAIDSGFFAAEITNVETPNYNNELYVSLTWEFNKTSLKDKLKLWASDPKEKKRAEEKLKNICAACDISFPNVSENKARMDIDVFKGRQAEIEIAHYGEKQSPYVKNYKKITHDFSEF
jgi:hypothetical protein